VTPASPVLVVEDDGDIRESLMDFLQDHGYPSIGAADGREALDTLLALERPPCVIILDLMMPGMDGRAFREQQLRHPALLDIPVVVVSAYKDVAECVKGLEVATYLPKPLNLDALLQLVREHCDATRACR
jgi:DNA-binding response OmpR family regulator